MMPQLHAGPGDMILIEKKMNEVFSGSRKNRAAASNTTAAPRDVNF
jgi:hypothetical protein